MEENELNDRLKDLNQLSKNEQLNLKNEILSTRPELLRRWWFWEPCEVNVLIVTDGGLDFGLGGFGLSNFLTIFKKIEAESNTNIKYNVTLGHRDNPGNLAMQMTNPDFVNKITGFKFDNTSHFTTTKYDQVWLFGISTFPIDSATEVPVINEYMNKGGGVFATGDHGSLGVGLCGNIIRVKDMRHWQDFSGGEVSMSGSRRNDTNTPHSGNFSSTSFSDQGDNNPQNIHARVYGSAPNLLPHYLLSINKNIKPSGIIDIMPDHPHEGECKPETDFVVINPKTGNNHTIRTQNIAVSFVVGGNTAGFKSATDPHCFASISVFDGRSANVGRIVVDSTWHHFVNVNLTGFSSANYTIIEQYFKNIAKWVTRKKNMLCFYRRHLTYAMLSERIMEANTLNPDIKADNIPDDELFAIGVHAMNILETESTPADALQFGITMLESVAPELSKKIDIWNPERNRENDSTYNQFINYKPFVAIAIGLGIARVKDEIGYPEERITEKEEIIIKNTFEKGVEDGLKRSFEIFEKNISFFNQVKTNTVSKDYLVEGTIVDAKGKPVSGLTVRATDLDFVGENILGKEVVTNKKGNYKIQYKQTDFIIDGKESKGPDIVIYIINQKGDVIHKTDVQKNSSKKSKINIKLK